MSFHWNYPLQKYCTVKNNVSTYNFNSVFTIFRIKRTKKKKIITNCSALVAAIVKCRQWIWFYSNFFLLFFFLFVVRFLFYFFFHVFFFLLLLQTWKSFKRALCVYVWDRCICACISLDYPYNILSEFATFFYHFLLKHTHAIFFGVLFAFFFFSFSFHLIPFGFSCSSISSSALIFQIFQWKTNRKIEKK